MNVLQIEQMHLQGRRKGKIKSENTKINKMSLKRDSKCN